MELLSAINGAPKMLAVSIKQLLAENALNIFREQALKRLEELELKLLGLPELQRIVSFIEPSLSSLISQVQREPFITSPFTLYTRQTCSKNYRNRAHQRRVRLPRFLVARSLKLLCTAQICTERVTKLGVRAHRHAQYLELHAIVIKHQTMRCSMVFSQS